MSQIKSLVENIFSQPTAPFREGWVLEAIEGVLKQFDIPYFFDDYGNLVASNKTFDKTKPGLAFLAHTDHPGFHILHKLENKKGSSLWKALWLGGAPFADMKGSAVAAYDPQDPSKKKIRGKIVSISEPRVGSIGREMILSFPLKAEFSELSFGAFDFPGFSIKKDRLTARAADDLAGCLAILKTLIEVKKNKLSQNVIGIFTRGEEVGYIGCIAFLKKNLLSKKSFCISIESSRELPGAKIGEGPVLRLGDRSTLFQSHVSNWMWRVAEKIKTQNKRFKFQRRVMDGGSCEATALSTYGHLTSGISIPLGNYHNQGKTKPAAEYISMQDLEKTAQLCLELSMHMPESFEQLQEEQFDRIEKNFRAHQDFLKASHRFPIQKAKS